MDSKDEKTVVGALPKSAAVRQISATSQLNLTLLSFGDGQGINPIINAAAPLLILLAELKQVIDCSDVDKLRQRLIIEVKNFTSKARIAQVSNAHINLASYIICAALDEAILKVLQNRNNLWTQQALLSIFHKDGGAGEKFFGILEHLNQEPLQNQMLLELLALCLDLGFEGKYRVMENGQTQLQIVKTNLANQLIKLRADKPSELVTDVQPVKQHGFKLSLRVTIRKAALALLGLIILTYFILVLLLGSKANTSLAILQDITAFHTNSTG